MLAAVKDVLEIIREALVIVVIGIVLLFPSQVGAWLFEHGVKNIEAGGLNIDLAQFNSTKDVLNAVENAAGATAQQPEVQQALQKAAVQLQQTIASQVRALSQGSTSVLPRSGWIYLGTIDAGRVAWRAGFATDVSAAWPVAAGQTVTLATDTNLREDSTSETRPQARIVSVLPTGTKVTVRELDTSRAVPAGDRAAPGFRVWAKVDVAS